MPPLVSILIVTWNRKADLVRSISSALAQTLTDKEVVVVDNASSDGTAELVARDFPQIRLIRSHRNLGCPSGRNLGVANCRGKYVYMLDDDGWLKDDAVEVSLRRIVSDESIAVVMSAIHEVQDGKAVRVCPEGLTEPAYRHSFVGCCAMVRKDDFDRAGCFPDDFFRQGEENDLAIRLLEAGKFCFFEPASVMYHAPSPVGRDLGKFLYYALRNTNKTCLRHWPPGLGALKILGNYRHAFAAVFTRGKPAMPLRLTGSLVRDICLLRGRRKPVSRRTLRLYLRLQKRPSQSRP